VVRFGEQAGRIVLQGESGDAPIEIELTLSVGDGKRALLNGARLRAAEQLRTELATLVFTPDRLAVVKGGPAARRAYFDRMLGRLAPARAQLPTDYGAALAQRNAALRRAAGGFASVDSITPWTQQVASLGAELVHARCECLALLAAAFAARAGELDLDEATLTYEGEAPTEESLDARLARDLERGATGEGPHLHDVAIAAAARDLRSFGSQGEQRTAVLALLLAEAELIEERRGTPPLLLLDDVLSELDLSRRRALVEQVEGRGQTVITATTADALPGRPAQLLEVSPGRVAVR
jgi:DNA replication and repair protein RecF